MNRRHFLLHGSQATVGVCLLPLAGCAASSPKSTRTKADRESFLAGLEKLIPRLMRQARVPGCSIALVQDGELFWRRGFGGKDGTSGEPLDNETVFEAASVSTTVFAYAVMKLVERGVIGQVATATSLCVAAGLLVRSYLNRQRFDPGFDTSRLIMVGASLNSKLYADPDWVIIVGVVPDRRNLSYKEDLGPEAYLCAHQFAPPGRPRCSSSARSPTRSCCATPCATPFRPWTATFRWAIPCSLLATLLPARRAPHINPVEALRYE